ncbi:MAG TPA: TolC family protein [Verrucomicrobiae bacterium]|nr:TolC family protein [Verrucomicrobiae bacterium]
MTLTTPILLAAAVPLALAGCTSTNPKPAFNEVNRTVTARLSEPVQWPQHLPDPQITQAVDALLKTNLTAQSATAIALLNNRSLQADFEQIGISQADLAQSSRLPNLELAGSWRFPDRPPSAVDVEYSAAGNFLDLLTLPARKKIAARHLEQTKLEVADKVLQLAADAQSVFYTLQAQMELTNRLGTIVAVDAAAADFARRQYDAGNINDLDLRNQQASAAQSHFDLMQAQAETQADRERLNRLLGLADGQIRWRIADELPALPATEPPLTNLETLAIKQRLDLAAARSQAESLAAALRLKEHTRFIPGLNVGVDSERTPDGQRVTGPTLDLELPLFDQGQPAVARLMAKYRQAEDHYQALGVNVRSEVRQARDALLAERAAVQYSQEELLPLRTQVLHETLLQYNAMGKSVYDLLLAKDREQMAEQSSLEAQRDYWLARVALDRAVGGRLSGEALPSPAPAEDSSSPENHQPEHVP